MPSSTMNSVADGDLRDHESTLFRTFLKLLGDDCDTQDLVTFLLWTDPAGKNTVLATTGIPSEHTFPDLAEFKDDVLRWVHEQNRPLILDNSLGVLGRMQTSLDAIGLRSASIFPTSTRMVDHRYLHLATGE